jgi:serine/threonine protein kinase/tetratricopeptide (TPR) repeat protein
MYLDDRTETVPALPPPADRRYLPPGTLVGNRYEIRGYLGSGGHGTVYRVFDQEVRREIALKLLNPERETPSGLQRFRREVQVARDTESPRLVRIFDLGTSPQGTYLTMELVDGPSLREILHRGPLPVEQAIQIAVQIFEGLAALHRLNIIHRDVKPGNVLLAGGTEAKLADFGLAHHLDREETQVTRTEGVVGTLDYLAPEQVLGRKAGKQSDLYAAGLVLFGMLTGRLPHEVDSYLGQQLGALQSAPDVRTLRPEVPRWLAGIVSRLLEVRFVDRYPSAEEVLRDLAREKGPRRVLLRRLVVPVAAVLVLCLPQTGVLLVSAPRPTFSHLVPWGEQGIAAIDTTGKTLWTKPDVDPEMAGKAAMARIAPGGPRLIAVVLAPKYEWAPEAISKLSFLDPQTGRVVKDARLPWGASFFPSDPPRFAIALVKAVDLFHDGVDDVLVSYHHVPEAPSYTVLYSPRADRAKIVFYAFGGHRFQGATDMDGDGTPDLLFTGINNGWNWVNAVAAVRLDPWPWTEEQWMATPTASPDAADEPSKERHLLWYAVIPRGNLEDSGLTIDEPRRELRVRYQSGRIWTLGFNGFASGTHAARPREEARRETYHHFREAERLRRTGALDLAMAEARAAREAAERAEESWLSEFAERTQAKILVNEGKMREAEFLFASLIARAEDAPEVAYDAAVAFHLAGDLRRAVAWYERGMGQGSGMGAGKSKHEFLKGEVLALVEEKRFDDALKAVDRFGATYYPAWNEHLWRFREYVRWRAGERPHIDLPRVLPNWTDLERYWELEFEFAGGGEPQDILPRVDRFLTERPETRAELLSLRAELLARLDRVREAAETAQSALELVRVEATRSIVARGHLDLLIVRDRDLRERLLRAESADPSGTR